MAQVKFHKYVAALPAQLEADTLYFVRSGVGYDLYVTNHGGTIAAYRNNAPWVFQQAAAPSGARSPGDRWLNTESGVWATWVVTSSGGQWVGDDASASAQQFQGDIELMDPSKGVILRSPNGTRWRVTVDNSGTLVRTSL